MDHIVGPTTQGMSDSEQALEYDSPKKTPYPSLVFPFFKIILIFLIHLNMIKYYIFRYFI
jgi:hypothetical protein